MDQNSTKILDLLRSIIGTFPVDCKMKQITTEGAYFP